MKKIDLANVPESGGFSRPEAGGYICRITSVIDVPEKEYLIIEYDIADGEFKNYFKDAYDNTRYWFGSFIQSYKEKALPRFKGLITAVENSNSNYTWNSDEHSLEGKYVGLEIGEEEYEKKNGGIGIRYYIEKPRTVSAIRSGEFEVPRFRQLAKTETPQFKQTESVGKLPWEQ